MPRVLDVIPVSVSASVDLLAPVRRRQAPLGVDLEVVLLPGGPSRVETFVEAALAAPLVCELVLGPTVAGADAVVVDCMLDPGVREARELTARRVVGPNEAAVASLSGRFTRAVMVTIDTGVVPGHVPCTLARTYPGGEHVAGFVGVPTKPATCSPPG